jgi:peptidoglycan/LPS O-acetylase OafA/YrhL
MKHIKLLDGIRGWAIIFVMLYHFTISFQQTRGLNSFDFLFAKIFGTGWLGVDLFFVMSGFLITSILYKSINNPSYFKNFYVRRLLRIFPLYYGVLFLLLIVIPTLSNSLAEKTAVMQENSFWFWSYLVNWKVAQLGTFNGFQSGYMWSLAVEEQFYIFWPLFVRVFYKKLIKASLFLFAISLAFKSIAFYLGLTATTIYTMTFSHMDGLLLGSIFGVLFVKGTLSSEIIKNLKLASCLSVVVIVVIALYTGGFSFYNKIVASLGVTCASIIFCYVLIKTVYVGNSLLLQTLFSNHFVIRCGQLCYGLYLLHQPIGVIISEKVISTNAFEIGGSYLPATLINVLLSFSLSLLCAQLSYTFFELHFLKLKKYFV